MKTPSIFSALQQLRILLTRKEKMQWLSFVIFAFFTGGLEIITAITVVLFSQILHDPTVGENYLAKFIPNAHIAPSNLIFYAVLLLGFVYLIKNSVTVCESLHQNLTIQKMSAQFKHRLLIRYSQVDYGFYLTRNSSQGLHVITGDVELVFTMALIPLAGILSEGCVTFGLLSVLVYMNPALAGIILLVSLLFIFVTTKYVLPLFYRWGEVIQQEGLHSLQHLMQFFHAYKEMVLLGKQSEFINTCQIHIAKRARVQGIQSATNTLPRSIIEVMFMGFLVGTIALLCSRHESPAQMMAILSGYLYAGFRLMPGFNRILGYFNVLKSQIPPINRLYEEYNALPQIEPEELCPSFAFEKGIRLNQVCFQYISSESEALNNVSLEIKKGECIGIIGTTGSGKSTLVDLVLGLLKPTSGSILIDDKFSVSSKQWHEKIGYVPQATYLMDDTIEANIAFGDKTIDAEQLQHAIQVAQLRDLIEQLPDGVKTMVGERGVRLSGGERQRIAIARALYRNPEVLIFDEATSALDNETESRLMETIYEVSQNRTVIMIAHRISTLQRCSRIVVMEKGGIKAITHYNLLE